MLLLKLSIQMLSNTRKWLLAVIADVVSMFVFLSILSIDPWSPVSS